MGDTRTTPLRVAIIGSGPSAFYTAEALQKQAGQDVHIDMFERLPTPFGLVRGGVAPDHQKIKSVTRVYDRSAQHPGFRFFGNVTFGQDITHDDLAARYHAIVYATGAQTDRRMNIPGEDLPGSHAATEFVGWYNGHPDKSRLEFESSQERVAVIGNGEVAIRLVRCGASPRELQEQDIADYALEALRTDVKEIYRACGAGGAAKFTSRIKELRRNGHANIRINPSESSSTPRAGIHPLRRGSQRRAQLQALKYTRSTHNDKPKRYAGFLVSPVETWYGPG